MLSPKAPHSSESDPSMSIARSRKDRPIAVSAIPRYVFSQVTIWDDDSQSNLLFCVVAPSLFDDDDIQAVVCEALSECGKIRGDLRGQHATTFDLVSHFISAVGLRGFMAHVESQEMLLSLNLSECVH